MKQMLLSVLIAAMVVPPVYAQDEPASQSETEFKIASYNIAAKGSKTTQIGQLLTDEGITIAGFQEVDYMNGRNNKDMLKEIAEAAGDGYDYYFQKAIDYSGGEYGIGIVTNGTLSNKNGASLETGGYEGRCWQRAEVTVGGKLIAVYNTHLTWENQDVRMQQMRDVLTVMEEDETPYKVLTGDFNAQESNDEFDAFLREYTIANGKDGQWLDTYIPFDATMKTNAIDNIITTRNIKIKSVEAKEISDIGSDHRVLIATCELLDEEQPSTQLLDKQISKAEAMAGQTTVYTEESLAELSAAIEAAKNADTSSQDTINAAVTALNDAMANMQRLPVERSTPVAYWDFDGDEPLKDKTGRGNDGVEGGTISFQPGLANLGNALCTKDGYVVVAKTTNDLNLGTEDFSVGFWYKASNPGEWSAVLGDKNWNSGGNPGMAIVQGQGQFYTSYAANGCARQENIVSGTASKVYDDKWHYIVAVLDRDDSSLLYVDGELIASTSIASTANNDATVSNPFYIGTDASTVYGIDSLIDDVKVYRNVLSPEEIIDEYELNRDQSAFTLEELIQKTETELSTLVIDPTQTTNMPTFESADGQYISRLYCSENDLTINDQGEILRQPLTDKKVQVSYIVQENKEGVSADDGTIVKNKWVTVKGKTTSGSNELPEVVPTMQEWCGADGGSFTFNENSRIVVSANDMGTLQTAAEITKDDIQELFGLSLAIVTDEPKAGDLVLTFENGDEKLGEQGYSLEIGDYVTIRGTAYRGVFFGTRSLLQGMLSSGNNSIACGTAVDYPNYEIREFMLDLGRKYFPMWYLEDMIKYASWFKLTDFQAHISEDTFNDYSAFRLESDIPHLTSTDGYYTKDEYRDFQKHAQNYGIRVITEIDGPAHARRFIELGNYEDSPEKYKNLGLDGTHFNLSNDSGARDRVLGLMDEILEEFLGGDDPVIITDAFNIGMDEYFGNQDDLRAYAVHMYDQVVNKYHKTAFAWDSNASLANASYPAESYPMDDIVINFWKWEEVSGGMKALMDQGYKVVNGDHRWYIVPGAQIGFYDYANEEKLYNEVSAGNMVGWYGNGTIFPEGHPSIVGGNMLIWNDRGMFAGYTVNDIFARQRSQYPYLSQAYWYGHEENETFSEFKEKVNTVGVGPGLDNLYKDIDSQGEVVYNFDMESLENNVVKDNSGNNYDATVVNGQLTNGKDGKQLTFNGDGYIETQHKALKWPYTAVFDLTIDTDQTGDITLFEEIMPEQECVKKDGNETGQEKSVIVLKEQEDGTYRLTYSREGFDYEHDFTFEKGLVYRIAFSSDESKPTGGEYAKWNQPNTLYVNGTLVSTLQGPAKPDDFTGGSWWVDSPSINMPLEKIGQNLVGSIDNFQLYNRLLTSEEIADLGGFDSTPVKKNLALNKPIEASSSKNDSSVASYANDGDQTTRWGSNYNSSTNDPFDKEEWLCIDLKDSYDLGTVNLYWQDAYAQEYTIQVSEDGETFTDALKVTDGDGGTDVLDLTGTTGRYIRIYCTLAVPSNDSWQWNYGYSLFEVEVYEAEPQEYTVTFDVDGTKTPVTVLKADGKLGDKMPADPTKEGFDFVEWNTKSDGTGTTITAETAIEKDLTVYAIFEESIVSDNLAFKKPIEASSSKSDTLVASNANDGDQATRWASNYNSSTNDPFDKEEWLCIDLKDSYNLGTVNLYWEDAYAKEYTIQLSEDGETFTDVLNVTDGDGETDVLDLAGAKGRYIRIYCTLAVPSNDSWQWNYGYSLLEVEVYEAEPQEYTVTFDVDGTKTPVTVLKTDGKLGDKMPADPTKEGFDFIEWNTEADGTGTTVTADTAIEEDLTVYAIFKESIVSDNLAFKKPIEASSIKNDTFVASNANDGDQDTRWGSNYNSSTNDPFDKTEWLCIDLKDSYNLGTVKLYWEDAYAKEYTIQLSEDGETFTDVLRVTGGNGGTDVLDLKGAKGRYFRIYCTLSVPSDDDWKWNYGYSLFEVEVYEGEEPTAKADKSELESLIKEADAQELKDYTDASVDNFNEALANAKKVMENDTLTEADQQIVDDAVKALKDAISALKYKDADYTQVDAAIAEANALNKDQYTNYSAVDAAVKAVVRGKNITEQDAVDAMAKAIEDAIAALTYKDADYTKVDEAIEKANALNKDDCEDFSAVDAAVKAVVRGKNITEQDAVDAMAKAIEDAIAALTYKDADYTKVDEAIEKANALNKDDYKDFSAVDAAIQAVVRGKNITEQDAVDAMAKAIEDAIAALEEVEAPVVLPYEDVNESDWFYNYVYDVYVKKLMTGLEETVFGPGNNLVRAQFAVIIYRMEGEPEVIFKDTFADVKDGNFYSDAVIWAAENGIVTGYTATGLFGPNDKITREQMAAIMFRYAKYKQLDTAERENLDDFTDGEKVQPFAIDAMEWCVAKGIISGKGEDDAKYLDPQTGASRAECATIISRYTDMK